jgi:sec-independent protein translocase protein TatC
MTFTEHLGELRDRLIRSMMALAVAVVVCFIFSPRILETIVRPLAPLSDRGIIKAAPAPGTTAAEAVAEGEAPAEPAVPTAVPVEPAVPVPAASGNSEPRPFNWTVLNPFEPIKVQLKIASYGGLVFAFPFILWQLCAFIFPGLKASERKLVKILLFGCAGLGVLGVSVAYFGVFPLVLPYLLDYTPMWVTVQLRLDETLTIIVKGLAGFALAFQFPMVVLTLVHMNLLHPQTLRQHRKVVIVGLSVAVDDDHAHSARAAV